MSKFKLSNSSVTLINRGGLKFHGTKQGNDVIFDTDMYADPRIEFSSSKVSTPLGAADTKAAQEELVALMNSMGAESLDKKTKE